MLALSICPPSLVDALSLDSLSLFYFAAHPLNYNSIYYRRLASILKKNAAVTFENGRIVPLVTLN